MINSSNHHQSGDVKEVPDGHQIIINARPKAQSIIEKQVTIIRKLRLKKYFIDMVIIVTYSH